jgi:mono/diheme cytochrome c family protein
MQYSQSNVSRSRVLGRTLAIAALTIAVAACAATAQSPNAAAPPAPSSARSFYTEAQAARGESTYRANCASCHTTSTHTGVAFITPWEGRTAFDLFELIRTTMPIDNPGRLSREQYADIVAYMFKLNGLPAGEKPLPADDEGLKQVRIEPKQAKSTP